MELILDLQNPGDFALPLTDAQCRRRIEKALTHGGYSGAEAELTVRVVGPEESAALNASYRNKGGPTNVLSFPAEVPGEIELPLLGDLVICMPLVEQEAAAQVKSVEDHFSHLLVHGVLHLLGFDHQTDDQAEKMEALEIAALDDLGIANPYEMQVP